MSKGGRVNGLTSYIRSSVITKDMVLVVHYGMKLLSILMKGKHIHH